jgi:AhpD family alkylhydroperoxidase
MGVMANSPAFLKAYRSVAAHFDTTSLTPTERQIILLTVSALNGCNYCMAAHTVIAGMQKVDAQIVDALRKGNPLADDRLEALRLFAADVVETRGWPSEASKNRFLAVGYSPSQMLEVVLGIGLKTLSNYANHLAGTPLDSAFAKAAWTQPASQSSQCCAH